MAGGQVYQSGAPSGPPGLRQRRVASLEGGEAGLATASGMGAITATLWTLIQAGDTIVADQTLY